MLQELSRKVNQLTDLRIHSKVNAKGQRVEGINIMIAFDEDMKDFLAWFLKGGTITAITLAQRWTFHLNWSGWTKESDALICSEVSPF
jgi:hypothetical protein